MTLTTRAEHEMARETDRVRDDLQTSPYAIAEDHVMAVAADASEADPVTVDADAVAREAAEAARDEVADEAATLTRSRSVAEFAAEGAFMDAHDAVLELLKEDPAVELEGSV